ncbi:MAG: hypothetical protein K5696_06175 [Lachnospiraceae bacterium]|nr:hypothetical protein [Lachnospiraceae bacterium]
MAKEIKRKLTDQELEEVNGGQDMSTDDIVEAECTTCGVFQKFKKFSGSRYKGLTCGHRITL